MSAERLQKVLANAGIASRRDCEELISAGRVSVNGKVARVLGARVDPEHDEITVDGRPIGRISPRTYVMLHKPVGVVSTTDDPQGRPTVLDLVDLPTRLFPVGRLDYDSEGLLLLTDDGELTQRLTHPSYEVEKEYHALLDQPPTPDALREWRAGVPLEGAPTAPAWVDVLERDAEGTWVRVVLHEGRKRQIRAVAGQLGYNVLRLVRVREGPLALGDLPAGQWRRLTDDEVEMLWAHVGGRDAAQPRAELDEQEHPRERSVGAGERPRRRPWQEQTSGHGTRRAAPATGRIRDDRPPPDDQQDERGDWARSQRGERPPVKRADDRPRRDDRRDDVRAPRRDNRSHRDDRPYEARGPRRDDRRDDVRAPRRDDRPYAARGPRRDDRRDDVRAPRRADRSRQDDRPYEARGSRRDDRAYSGFRGPRRDDRSEETRGFRRDEERGAARGEHPREPRRDDDFASRSTERPEPGNERPSYDERQEKRGPGREWHARQQQEERERKQGAARPPRRGGRGGMQKRSGVFRPKSPKDHEDES